MTNEEIVIKYLGMNYDFRTFNCWHLVDSVRADLGYQSHKFSAITPAIRDVAKAFEIEIERGSHGMHQQPEMNDYDVVIMSKPWAGGFIYHCGIAIDGRILHAHKSGVSYDSVDTIIQTWPRIEFWR